jgi:hypothetical protein
MLAQMTSTDPEHPHVDGEARLAADGAVGSEQRLPLEAAVVEHSTEGAARLGRAYWREVERATRGLVRPAEHDTGLDLRLVNRVRLLRFGPPELEASGDTVTCRYPIVGGLLARAPGGWISFAQRAGAQPELSSTIAGFHPRLAARPGRPDWTGALYAHVQARIHRAVGRRYFERLRREGLQ